MQIHDALMVFLHKRQKAKQTTGTKYRYDHVTARGVTEAKQKECLHQLPLQHTIKANYWYKV
jgi:hypothetical protein